MEHLDIYNSSVNFPPRNVLPPVWSVSLKMITEEVPIKALRLLFVFDPHHLMFVDSNRKYTVESTLHLHITWKMQRLFKLVYSATLGILVVVVTKVILDSDPFSELGGQTDALFNTSLFSVIGSIRGDINLLGENSEASEVTSVSGDNRHHVYTPPVGTELEANDQAKLPVLFASGDGTLSLETRDQFSELMSLRSRRLREVCDATSETNRKFNFRSFYVLKVNMIQYRVQTQHFPFLYSSEPLPGLVPRVQGRLHQLDAQPSLPGRQE